MPLFTKKLSETTSNIWTNMTSCPSQNKSQVFDKHVLWAFQLSRFLLLLLINVSKICELSIQSNKWDSKELRFMKCNLRK